MLDHVFISVSDIDRSIDFYTAALAPLGIRTRVDYDGKDGPPGHPDLKGFGADGRIFFWLRHGATDNGAPSYRDYYDPRYYAASVFDPDGYSLEFTYKSWQH